MAYSLRQAFISRNRSGEGFSPQGVVVHSTATKGATAQAEYSYFNSGDRGASAHAFVDWIEAVQTIPWGEKAWHSMSYGNNHFIGIELCEPAGHNVAQFNAVWSNAVELFAQLFLNVLHQKTVTKDNLLSHAEVSARWRESDHTDPVGYFREYGKTVDNFRADVQARINVYIKPKNSLPDIVWIDNPKTGFTTSNTFELNGWALSSVKEIELLINGSSCGKMKLTVPREDVYKAYPKYNNHNAGFRWGINIKSLKMGENTLTVWSGDANQSIKVIRK